MRMSVDTGLAATLGGAIAHDEELGIRARPLPGEGLEMTLPFAPALALAGANGRVAPGVVATLLDTVCGVSAMDRLGYAEAVATLDLRIDYLRQSAPEAALEARGRAVSVTGTPGRGSLLITAEAADPGGTVALATGRFIRRPLPAPGSATPTPKLRRLSDHGTYPALMGFVEEAPGIVSLPFREGLIGNGALPSIHGGVLASHLHEAAERLVGRDCRIPLQPATAYFAFLSFGAPADLRAEARIDRRGSTAIFVSAASTQSGRTGITTTANFTFLATPTA